MTTDIPESDRPTEPTDIVDYVSTYRDRKALLEFLAVIAGLDEPRTFERIAKIDEGDDE